MGVNGGNWFCNPCKAEAKVSASVSNGCEQNDKNVVEE